MKAEDSATPSIPSTMTVTPQQRRTQRTRFVCVSDTHNCTVKLPPGDVLIHCGDLTNQGSYSELSKQVAWLEKAVASGQFECAIVIAGNHDLTLDLKYYEKHGAIAHNNAPQDAKECQKLFKESKSLIYLQHESRRVNLSSPCGPRTTFSVFGSPYTPNTGGNWAFRYERTSEGLISGEDVWKDIPLDTDVLITHGPAHTMRDTKPSGQNVGCESLRMAMRRVRPRLALCGHCHEGRGVERVRWDLGDHQLCDAERCESKAGEERSGWVDPGASNAKNSLVDLTAKGGLPLDNDGTRTPTHLPQSDHATDDLEEVLRDEKTVDIADEAAEGSQTGAGGIGNNTPGSSGYLNLLKRDELALEGRLGRRETCIVNCAIMASSHPHTGPRQLNKPIVVDIDLPVWHNP